MNLPDKIPLKAGEFRLELSPRGRGMLFNTRTGEVLTVNKSGAFLLELLRTGTDTPSIVKRFADQFRLPGDAAESDIREFFGELRKLGILEEPAEP